MRQEFVEFYSPGTFLPETRRMPIETRDVDVACEMAKGITERYGATPFGFRFIARERGDDDLDARDTDLSSYYYLGGKVETLAEVEARATEDDEILLRNMRNNGIKRIITNTNSWKFTGELYDDDVVLDWPR